MPRRILHILVLAFFISVPFYGGQAANTALAGRILLQTEEHGEAWYVHPGTLERYYLGRPYDAFNIMRGQGIGITDDDLSRIPVALDNSTGVDCDGDGLVDGIEDAIGTDKNRSDSDGDGYSDRDEIEAGFNPAGNGRLPLDAAFSRKQAGRIFLQVEGHGEAWYVSPVDAKRYFLGRPSDAFALMRALGLGITDRDLVSLTAGQETEYAPPAIELPEIRSASEYFDFALMEKVIQDRINLERVNRGLKELKWNSDLATVAREHSLNLAAENQAFAGIGVTCDYPLIHHEGPDFGPYASDRLHTRGIYYFSKAGENIALLSGAEVTVRIAEDDPQQYAVENCVAKRANFDNAFAANLDRADTAGKKLDVVRAEVAKRASAYRNEAALPVAEIDWFSSEELAADMVAGWMESEGHRKNILDPDYGEAGIGLAEVDGYVISTQVFIERADCGYETGPLPADRVLPVLFCAA